MRDKLPVLPLRANHPFRQADHDLVGVLLEELDFLPRGPRSVGVDFAGVLGIEALETGERGHAFDFRFYVFVWSLESRVWITQQMTSICCLLSPLFPCICAFYRNFLSSQKLFFGSPICETVARLPEEVSKHKFDRHPILFTVGSDHRVESFTFSR